MAQKERLETIRRDIQLNKRVSVSVLSRELKVTEETIRRDLEKLEQEGILTRTHGGAVRNTGRVMENSDYMLRKREHHQEKAVIGALAASVVPDRATVGADASTTVMEAVRLLRDRPELTILTNSTQIICELAQSPMKILSTGGMVNPATVSLQGKATRKALADYYVDIALISCKALDLSGGIFDANEEEGEIKKLLVEHGQKIALLADYSKFDRVAFTRVLDFKNLDVLVTDREPSEAWRELCAEKDVELLYPGCGKN